MSLPEEYDKSVKDLMKIYEKGKVDIDEMTKELMMRFNMLQMRRRSKQEESEDEE